jgi:hypothetical protein
MSSDNSCLGVSFKYLLVFLVYFWGALLYMGKSNMAAKVAKIVTKMADENAFLATCSTFIRTIVLMCITSVCLLR